MSMSLTTLWQTIAVFFWYTVLVMSLPAIAFVRKLRVMNTPDRFMFCVVVGNFWIITAVLLLFLLHIANVFTCFLFTYGLALMLLYLRNKRDADTFFKRQWTSFRWLISGELRGILYLKRLCYTLWHGIGKLRKRLWKWAKPRLPELILICICMAGAFWFLSYQSQHYYSFGTTDVVVHSKWINTMLDGKIFYSGVYPYGFHCIVYYIALFTGMDVLVLLRVFGVVASMYIFLLLYLFARGICRSKYAAMIAFAVYTLSSAFHINAMMRFQWSLPQEYAMLFLYPMAHFLFKYLKQYRVRSRQELRAQRAEYRERRKIPFLKRAANFFTRPSTPDSSTLPLLLSSISVSLTLTTHFYVTIAAFELFLGVVIANIRPLFKPYCLRRLVCYMVLFVMIAAAPMVAAIAMGTPPENSLLWGMSIVDDYEHNSLEVNQEPYKSEIYSADIAMMDAWNATVAVVKSALSYLQCAVTTGAWYYTSIACIVLTFVVSLCLAPFSKRSDYFHKWLSLALYTIMLISIVKYPMLGFPALMEGSRDSIFLAYVIAVLYAFPFDLLFSLLTLWKKTTRVCNALLCAVCVAFMGFTRLDIQPTEDIMNADTPSKKLSIFYHFEYSTNVTLLYDLINQYEDYTWTLMSPVTESTLVHSHGRHEDLTTFMRRLDRHKSNSNYTIPTKYVFIAIEKEVLKYSETVSLYELYSGFTTTPVSTDFALEGFPEQSQPSAAYYTTYRKIMESKAYFWVKRMQELYPYEMTVYYEDDYSVVYRLTQNTRELFNLDIDYGYNASVLKAQAELAQATPVPTATPHITPAPTVTVSAAPTVAPTAAPTVQLTAVPPETVPATFRETPTAAPVATPAVAPTASASIGAFATTTMEGSVALP